MRVRPEPVKEPKQSRDDRPPDFSSLTDKTATGDKRGPGRPPKAIPSRADSVLQATLTQQFVMIGTAVYALNQVDGVAIIEGSARLSESLIKTSKTNKRLRAVLETAATGGTYGELAIAVAAIAIPIMVNHGVIPPVPFAPNPGGDSPNGATGNGTPGMG